VCLTYTLACWRGSRGGVLLMLLYIIRTVFDHNPTGGSWWGIGTKSGIASFQRQQQQQHLRVIAISHDAQKNLSSDDIYVQTDSLYCTVLLFWKEIYSYCCCCMVRGRPMRLLLRLTPKLASLGDTPIPRIHAGPTFYTHLHTGRAINERYKIQIGYRSLRPLLRCGAATSTLTVTTTVRQCTYKSLVRFLLLL
jgi:hypothetical protein